MMKLPNQAKPVSREISPEFRGKLPPGAVRPSDWLDDVLRGVSAGTQVIGQFGQLAPLFF